MKSTAQAEAMARDLKDQLEFRGFSVAESKDAEGWPKLTLNTDEASIRFESVDAVSKDIFQNDLKAFTPHVAEFASRDDAMDSAKASKIVLELTKIGTKLVVKTHATVLATAEDADGEEIIYQVTWPTKSR